MSGGTFDYVQNRYELTEAIDRIEDEIQSGNWQQQTIEEFKNGLMAIKKMKIYLQRIDYLLACDDGEESFHSRLSEDLSELSDPSV